MCACACACACACVCVVCVDRYCPLHYAAEAGHAHLIDLIVCEGMAEAESETRDGLTALHLAVRNNHLHTVLALVRHMSQDSLNQQVLNPKP